MFELIKSDKIELAERVLLSSGSCLIKVKSYYCCSCESMKSMFLYYLDLRGLSDDLSIVHVGPADGRGPSARIYTGFNAKIFLKV